MLKGIPGRPRLLAVAESTSHPVVTFESSSGQRLREAFPVFLSWLTVLAPVWLTFIDPTLGLVFVSVFVAYFVLRGIRLGVRAAISCPHQSEFPTFGLIVR